MNRKQILLSILLILVALSWAGSFVVVKDTVDKVDAIDIGFLRFVVAAPIMFVVFLFTKNKKPIPKKEFPSLIILGLTGVTLLYIFQFVGIDLTTASTSSILINTNVVFIAIISAVFLKEKFSKKKIFGVSLSFVGVSTIVFAQINNENIVFSDAFMLGCIFILLSAFFWAVYSIIGKRLLKTYGAIEVTTYAFILGIIFYIPVVISDIFESVQKIPLNGWMSIFYLGVVCSVFGYVAWYYALKNTEASKAAVYLTLIPMFTIILSFVFLNEIPAPFFLVGAILIMVGVYQTQKS